MFPPLDYLAWMHHACPLARFDLASSGTPAPSAADLDLTTAIDDPGAADDFRDLVARRYRRPPGEVVVAPGASGALFVAYAALFERGDEVLIERPAYQPLVRVAEGLGLVVRRFDRLPAEGYAIDPREVERAMTASTRGVVVSELHNPTGASADPRALARVAEIVAGRGGHLLVDEAYADFAGPPGAAPRPSARELAPNVVAFGSLTKYFGLVWARAGYLLVAAEHVAAADNVLSHILNGVPTSVAVCGARALTLADELSARTRGLLAGKRARVDTWLAAHERTLAWHPPHPGAPFGFVRDLRGGDLRVRLENGLRDLGVVAAPGSFFDEPAAFRLAWNVTTDRLDEALVRLDRALAI